MKKDKGAKGRDNADPAMEGENMGGLAQPPQETVQGTEERRRQAAQRRQRQEEERQAAEEKRLEEAYTAGLRRWQEETDRSRLAQEGQLALEQELATIAAFDPAVHSIEDLMALEKAGELFALLRDNPGITLSQAYILTCFDRITAGLAQRAARAAAGKLMGTRHLQPMPGRSNGEAPIPTGTMEMYRALFPGKSDSDFARHWKGKNEGYAK